MGRFVLRTSAFTLAIAVLSPGWSSARVNAAQGCGLVSKPELHRIFHANVKTLPGETSLDCNFLAPKTGNVLFSMSRMSRKQFEHFRDTDKRRSIITNVSGLGGPAYWVDPRPANADVVGFGLYILHGSYQIQIDATLPVAQIHETKQATHSQIKQLARLIVKRAPR